MIPRNQALWRFMEGDGEATRVNRTQEVATARALTLETMSRLEGDRDCLVQLEFRADRLARAGLRAPSTSSDRAPAEAFGF